jgi:hypothetical protein
MTEDDVKNIDQAVRDVVKKFPELTHPKAKGWKGQKTEAYGGFGFASDPVNPWDAGVAQKMADLLVARRQVIGAGTAPDSLRRMTRTLINDNPDSGDGVHELIDPEKTTTEDLAAGSLSHGTGGQIYHELGHALAWATGVHDADSMNLGEGTFKSLLLKHGLLNDSETVSKYGEQSHAEGFAELFANYMTDNMDAPTRERFDGLLAEILGRKV